MFWFFGHEACGILAPRPEIEPTSPALEGAVLITGQPGKSPQISFMHSCFLLWIEILRYFICAQILHHGTTWEAYLHIRDRATNTITLTSSLMFPKNKNKKSQLSKPLWEKRISRMCQIFFKFKC